MADGPRVLKRLWLELQDSAHPTPSAKLAQARRDIAADPRRYERGDHRLPVAVTHQRGSTKILATMDIADVIEVLGLPVGGARLEAGEVTMPLDTLLSFVERGGHDRRSSAAEGRSMTAEIIFIVTAAIVVAVICGGDLLFDQVHTPQRDDTVDERDESEAS